jgi:hypothetical protein
MFLALTLSSKPQADPQVTRATVDESVSLWDEDDLDGLSSDRVEEVIFRRKPILNTYWSEMPTIRICLENRVSPGRASQFVSYWRRLGYDLPDPVFDREDSFTCRSDGARGEITVLLVSSDIEIGNNLAVTKTWYNIHTNEIVKAQIYLIGGFAERARLLEHELGHALGWGHFNRRLHIMNADYRSGGTDSTGLTQREYEREQLRLRGDHP